MPTSSFDWQTAKTHIHQINALAKRLGIYDDAAEAIRLVQTGRRPDEALMAFWGLFDAYLIREHDKSATEAEWLRTDAEQYWEELQKLLEADCAKYPDVAAEIGGGDDSAEQVEAETLESYRHAEWFTIQHGIKPTRLSEGKSSGKIKWRPAPAGMMDSEGRKVAVLYHIADAIKNCAPKRRTTPKSRR